MSWAASRKISEISARDTFTSAENIAFIKDSLLLRRTYDLKADELGQWYDAFMKKHQIEPSKIEDVVIWSDYMSDQFARHWRGRHNVSAEQVPYLPFDLPTGLPKEELKVEMKLNTPMVVKTQPSGRWPKFNLPSAVEDGLDENGEIIIHNEWTKKHMFQPLTGVQGKGWRFGKNDPGVMRHIAGVGQTALIDMDYQGSLYDWELLSRPHTKYPMEQFFTVG